METYSLRKNFKTEIKTPGRVVTAKVAFKTKEADWLSTDKPVILPISIHSEFNNEYEGEIKMHALTSTIKNHVKGKITIFMGEKAHIHTLSLKYQNDYEKACDDCMQSSEDLMNRYKTYFADCQVVRWSYITEDDNYEETKSILTSLLETDPLFRKCLLNDAEDSYVEKRIREYPNKAAYMEKALKDILEQCIAKVVLEKKGYQYLFYPGKPFTAQEYVDSFLTRVSKITWVNVSLCIKKQLILSA